MEDIILDGVTEYNENRPVKIYSYDDKITINALNEGGYNCVYIDLLELLKAISEKLPDIYMIYVPNQKQIESK